MKKAKKTKALRRRTELDRIATQLRTMLRRDTVSVIEKGKLLLRSRELLADDEGWQEWLAKNFDLSYRTAHRYVTAAKYVAAKSDTVSHFANLSPTVLYLLAEGHHTEQVEAEILAQAKAGKRVDEDAVWAICEKLAPADNDDDDADEDQDDEGGGDAEPAAAEDPEATAILDGPPPAVPPPPPTPSPTDFALRNFLRSFDQAIGTLKQLMTKSSANFDGTTYTVDDLEKVETFIRAVMRAKAAKLSRRAEQPEREAPQ